MTSDIALSPFLFGKWEVGMDSFGLTCFTSVGTCFVLSMAYVSSLYIWKTEGYSNHPSTIKKRFLSAFMMTFVSPFFLKFATERTILEKTSLFELMGFRSEGIPQAIFIPLFLTMILFLGPLATKICTDFPKLSTESSFWLNSLQDLMWLRAHIVAPLSEEFTFRSCMLPILLQCFSPTTAVFVCPLFFGVAHFHHMIERVKSGFDFKTALFVSCFQFTYTTIFGAYSAFLLLRTGHFISTFVVHSFCNHMGVPNVQDLMQLQGQQRNIVIALYFVGLALWALLLNALTEPTWYHNKSIWLV